MQRNTINQNVRREKDQIQEFDQSIYATQKENPFSKILNDILIIIVKAIKLGALQIIFGVLYLVFVSNKEYSDNCSNTKLQSWGFANGIFQFITLFLLGNYHVSEKFQNFLVYRFWSEALFHFLFVPSVLFAIAISVINDQACGPLYKLNIAFYSVSYISFLIIILLVLFQAFSGGMKNAFR